MTSMVSRFLAKHNVIAVSASELVRVDLPETHSTIVHQNGGFVYCFSLAGLEGLFRKDQEATKKYGRGMCDQVKGIFQCGGFFTSDELPRYGITRRDRGYIYGCMGKIEGDGQLIVILAYPEALARQIRDYLIEQLRRQAGEIAADAHSATENLTQREVP